MSNTPNAAPVFPQVSSAKNSGLQVLRDAVARYFEDLEINATVARVGFKYRTFQLNTNQPGGANRVCFIPGRYDGAAGAPRPRDYGEVSRETRNSSQVNNPREIAQWERPCTISIWSAPDPTEPQEEDLSLSLAEDLMEKVIRGLYSISSEDTSTPQQSFAMAGAFSLGSVTVVSPPNESSFGTELLLGITLRGPFFDVTRDVVFPTLVVGMPTFT